MIKERLSKFSFLQCFLDLLAITFVWFLIAFIRNEDLQQNDYYIASSGVIAFLLVSQIYGLYKNLRFDSHLSNYPHIFFVWGAVCFVVIAGLFGTKMSELYSRIVVFSWMLITPILLLSTRYLLSKYYLHNKKIKIALVGNNKSTELFLKHIQEHNWNWIEVFAIYDELEKEGWLYFNHKRYPLKPIEQLFKSAKQADISAVYVSVGLADEPKVEYILDELADTTASVYVIPDTFLTELMRSRWTSFGGLSLVSVYDTPFLGLFGWIKRLTDIVLASLILLLIWPIMLLIAIAVKITSKGPVFFKQRRYGLDGQVINVWKFRSMTVCEDGSKVTQAQKNDSRITPLGAFLRKTSLDELPQFINVLQGSMSVVGPRPHANSHNEEYRKIIKGYMLRHKVKPGITGWAQINGWRGETDVLEKMEKRVEYDLEYIQKWSLFLDLKIVFLTIFKGFVGKNAY